MFEIVGMAIIWPIVTVASVRLFLRRWQRQVVYFEFLKKFIGLSTDDTSIGCFISPCKNILNNRCLSRAVSFYCCLKYAFIIQTPMINSNFRLDL